MKRTLDKWLRRQKLKKRCVEYLGGKCLICEYNKCIGALDFHHRDETQKEFSITKAIAGEYAWDRICKELDKCDLLCSNCHREHHWDTFNDVNLTLIEEL